MEQICKRWSETKDVFGNPIYYPCGCKPAYSVNYISPTTGSQVIGEIICKRHYNALEKNCTRILKRTNFDSKLEATKL